MTEATAPSSALANEAVAPSLALFAEAIAGHPVGFTVRQELAECWPWSTSPRHEGQITVPAAIGNESHHRTVVLHQLLAEPAPTASSIIDRSPYFATVYSMVEDVRVFAVTRRLYPGAVVRLDSLLASAASTHARSGEAFPTLVEAVRGYSFGQRANTTRGEADGVAGLDQLMAQVELASATAHTSVLVARRICELLVGSGEARSLAEIVGDIEPDEEAPALSADGETGVSLDGGTPSEFEDTDGVGGGQLLEDGMDQSGAAAAADEERAPAGFDLEVPANADRASRAARTFMYDEWDYHEQRHRRSWCRVIEEQLKGDDPLFITDVRSRHLGLRARIRRSLMKMPAHELVRVYRSDDGDELDLDAAIEALADRRSGAPLDERLHIRRDRAARDVATAFLVDLSASTSSPAVPLEPEPIPDIDPMDDPMSYGPLWGAPPTTEPVRRVIDVAKDAVALMGDALHELGDRYAIYGFSGTGRDHVDFKIGKDFRDRVDATTWAGVAAMKPLRYTRMGPAVRHATTKLQQETARSKFLIVISDGYPQDTDYGRDRHDRDYGMHDTARALSDATALGIETFCLTIDPAGHDYLRQMCPDSQYLIIEDVESLPEELAKLYLRNAGSSGRVST